MYGNWGTVGKSENTKGTKRWISYRVIHNGVQMCPYVLRKEVQNTKRTEEQATSMLFNFIYIDEFMALFSTPL